MQTVDKENANAFSTLLGDGTTVRYFFDPDTKLCVQRSVIRSPTDASHIVFKDYRRIDGLPVPFKSAFYLNGYATEEYSLSTVRFGAVDGAYFVIPTY